MKRIVKDIGKIVSILLVFILSVLLLSRKEETTNKKLLAIFLEKEKNLSSIETPLELPIQQQIESMIMKNIAFYEQEANADIDLEIRQEILQVWNQFLQELNGMKDTQEEKMFQTLLNQIEEYQLELAMKDFTNPVEEMVIAEPIDNNTDKEPSSNLEANIKIGSKNVSSNRNYMDIDSVLEIEYEKDQGIPIQITTNQEVTYGIYLCNSQEICYDDTNQEELVNNSINWNPSSNQGYLHILLKDANNDSITFIFFVNLIVKTDALAMDIQETVDTLGNLNVLIIPTGGEKKYQIDCKIEETNHPNLLVNGSFVEENTYLFTIYDFKIEYDYTIQIEVYDTSGKALIESYKIQTKKENL